MTTYADPTRCPDCRAVLPEDRRGCRVCSLPLTGETARSLFETFQRADLLLDQLRAQKREPAVVGAAVGMTGSPLAGAERYPTGSAPRPTELPREPRVRGASVPKILLSLGALCLLVAAVTFLAVAWSWLGIGGRTGVLVALTGVALGLTVTFHRRGLRMAAEALSVTALGLLAVDVVGVRHAGWLGDLSDGGLTLLAGAVVATGALCLVAVTARRSLVAPALVAPLAVLVAGAGAQSEVHSLAPTVAAVIVLLGLGRIGTLVSSTPLKATALGAACPAWLALVVSGLDRVGSPITVPHYVGHGAGLPLLVATLLAAAAGPISGVRRGVAVAGYSVAGLVGSYTVVLPVLDNGHTTAISALLVVAAAWVAVLAAAPRSIRPLAALPLAGTVVAPVATAISLLGVATRAVVEVGTPFSQSWDVRVNPITGFASPLLLLPISVVLGAAACAAVALVSPVRRSVWFGAVGAAALLGGAATLPLYDVPLALLVGVLTAAGLAAFGLAERREPGTDLARLSGVVLLVSAVVLALPSDGLTTVVLAIACGVTGYLMSRSDTVGAASSAGFPLAFAGLVWAAGSTFGVHEVYRAVPVLIVLGLLAIWRPRGEVEFSSALAGAVVSAASVVSAYDVSTALAVHLTVAGGLVTTSSLVHPSRRFLAWPGGLLLAAATWVRLADLGVHVPEAYTLPSALVLVAVGGWRLRTDRRSATLTFLTPGLTLATVPSLVAMLGAPYSLRALLLGAACLALVLVGSALRWSAPLAVGAGVGLLVVLRELAPYAAQVPTWLTIGVSGAVLLVVGVTWESRMNDVRRASAYLAALR